MDGENSPSMPMVVIPNPDILIDCVNTLGTGQLEMMTYTDRHGRFIGDIEIPGVDADDDNDTDTASVFDDNIELPGVDAGEIKAPQQVEIYDLDIPGDPDPIKVETVEEEVVEYQASAVQAPEAVQAEPIPDGPHRSARIRTSQKTYTLSMSVSKYSFAVKQLEWQGVLNPDAHMFFQEDFYQAEPDVVAAVMTQLSIKAGLRAWGDKALSAFKSEMKQLHFRNTFLPKHWKDLTATQRRTVLESHLFLKEKRDGTIKGRTVAGGDKQRGYISKEDSSSPTVASESVLLSCIIDAK